MDGPDRTLSIRRLGRGEESPWERFVDAHPEATLFHRAAWRRAIEDALGHECHFLTAERGGAVVGVLPLVHVRSRLFGRALIGTGFTVGGGPLAADEPARAALDDAAVALADRLGVDHLEYRGGAPEAPGWKIRRDLYAGFRKRLDRDPERNLLAIPRKQRAVVRKALANGGLTVHGDDGIGRFHAVYAESVRNLGTPVLPKRWFRALRDGFGDACTVTTVVHQRRPVASVLSFRFRDAVLPYYGGGTAAARGLGANDLMYWAVMRRAGLEGCAWFDFGRSKVGSGAYAFKRNWGFAPEPIAYGYHLRTRDRLPEVNPTNPRYRLLIALWKRLPLPLSTLLGPPIARNLG